MMEQDTRHRDFERARESFEVWLVSDRGIDASGDELSRMMIGMGSRLFEIPGFAGNLGSSLRGEKLLRRLSLLDSASLHALRRH